MIQLYGEVLFYSTCDNRTSPYNWNILMIQLYGEVLLSQVL